MKNLQVKENGSRGMKTLYALGEKRKFDLSLSENPLGCSPKVRQILEKFSSNLNAYPEPNGTQLKRVLAEMLNCSIGNIFVANGSESIINDIPTVFADPGDEVLIPALSFPMFRVCSELAGLSVTSVPMTGSLEIDLDAFVKRITNKTKLVFLCNPNNPVGSVLSKEKIMNFLKDLPTAIIVVVDEASIGFGGESIVEEVIRFKLENVMILRTFSKVFGLANIRLGFAIGSVAHVQKLEEEQTIFPVSGISEKLAIAAMSDVQFVNQTKKFIDNQRENIREQLETLGFIVFPSDSNNLFVKLPARLSPQKFCALMKQEEISLIMGSEFSGYDDRFFRVSVREKEVNDRFLQVVRELIDEVQ